VTTIVQLLLSPGSRSTVFIEYARSEVKEGFVQIGGYQPVWWVFDGEGGHVSEGFARTITVMG
jgi:hypothetical protein